MATPRATAKQPRKITFGPVAQQQILKAVDELFYQEGARAVGVDAVVKRAGVNKMMLYRQFESKDALLLLYLERMDETFWSYFEESVAKHPGNPRAQMVQFFIDLASRAEHTGFRGCPFVNVAVEFPDPTHPARRMVANTKSRLLSRLLELAQAAQADDPQGLADGLALLIEGAYAASQTFGQGHPLMTAISKVAQTMVNAACGSGAA